MSDIGDNSVGPRLHSIVEELLDIELQKADLAERRKDIMIVAKSQGYTPKIIGMILRRRKRDKKAVEEEDALLETYEMSLEKKLPW